MGVRSRISNRPPAIFSASFLWGLAAFVLVGLFAARNLSTWPARLRYPGDESYEGMGLGEMLRLRQGVPIYAPSSAGGFDPANYGPLYYLLGSRLVSDPNRSYLPLRVLSVLAILGCAAGCGGLAFWLSRSYVAALLSPLVLLSYAMVTRYGVSALSDSVALFLFFWGFLGAYRFQRGRALFLAVPLMILGFFYKPQFVAAPVGVLTSLLIEKRYRRAAEFAGLLGLCDIGLLASFQWAVFRGQAFWQHFVVYNASALSWRRFGQGLFIFSIMLLVPLLFGCEYLRKYPDRMVSCYLVSAVALGLFTYCRDGSGVQYFLESVLVLSTLVPALLAKRIAEHAHPVDLVLVLGLMVLAGQWSRRSAAPQPADFARYDAAQQFLRHSFPSQARSLGLCAGDLAQAGLETPFSDLYLFALLAHRGLISDRDLATRIHERWFSVIVLSFDLRRERNPYWLNFCLTGPMRDAIAQEYQLSASLDMPAPERERAQDRFYIYVPRKSSDE